MSKDTVKKITYSDNDRAIVAVLKNAEAPLTIAELCEQTERDIKSGHVVSAMKKGLIANAGKKDIMREKYSEVNTYVYVDDILRENKNGKPFARLDAELPVLQAAKTFDTPFTLSQLSTVVGITVPAGRINALVNKGNLAVAGKTQVVKTYKAQVSTYSFVADIPADAE